MDVSDIVDIATVTDIAMDIADIVDIVADIVEVYTKCHRSVL